MTTMEFSWRTALPVVLVCFSQPIWGYFDIQRLDYTGYQNVWHEGRNHKTRDVKTDSSSPDQEIDVCAAFCSLDPDCDAFYMNRTTNGNCHLVDEDSTPSISRTYGHEWRTGKMYYVRREVPSNGMDTLPLPGGFEPPCDNDNTTLSASECSAFPQQGLTYYSCPFSSSRYDDTLNNVPDAKCPGENRLLLCELQGRDVETNVRGDTRQLFEPMFIKTAHSPSGLSVVGFQWLAISLRNAPRRITRIVIRTVDNEVERMKFAKLTVYSGQESESVDVDIHAQLLGSTCAVLVNFEHLNMSTALMADRIMIHDSTWYGYDKRGLKLDVFTSDPPEFETIQLPNGCTCKCPIIDSPTNSIPAPTTAAPTNPGPTIANPQTVPPTIGNPQATVPMTTFPPTNLPQSCKCVCL